MAWRRQVIRGLVNLGNLETIKLQVFGVSQRLRRARPARFEIFWSFWMSNEWRVIRLWFFSVLVVSAPFIWVNSCAISIRPKLFCWAILNPQTFYYQIISKSGSQQMPIEFCRLCSPLKMNSVQSKRQLKNRVCGNLILSEFFTLFPHSNLSYLLVFGCIWLFVTNSHCPLVAAFVKYLRVIHYLFENSWFSWQQIFILTIANEVTKVYQREIIRFCALVLMWRRLRSGLNAFGDEQIFFLTIKNRLNIFWIYTWQPLKWQHQIAT
jgi:hypothetical protein